MTDTSGQTLIRALQDPAIYDHPVQGFRVIETHISRVLLTGDYAYKIKKPVNFGFLDFSSLEQRRHFCEEELRLNRRLAEEIYLDVVPITGTPEQPVPGGTGEAIEYAVRMRQFRQEDLLDRRQEEGNLAPELLATLARRIADFHEQIPVVAEDSPLGTPDAVFAPMQENFDQIRPLLNDSSLLAQLDTLEDWTRTTFERHRELIAQRRAEGYVRECHGDLHLANITLFRGQPVVFDCIEFNEPFRWIDVINDLAFLLMDLEARQEAGLANLVLNTYLECRDDFAALALLPLYKAYRALVRAKIALFTRADPGLDENAKAGLMQRYRDYVQLAESYSAIPNRYLLATTGLSASGKSCVSAAMAQELGLIRLRSDVERKRLHGLGPLDASGSDTGTGIYTPEANTRTYRRLAQLAGQLLAAGLPVIVDAACLRRQERALLAAVAEEQGVPFALLHCEAPEALRREWIRNRRGDASEATEQLLDVQKSWFEPLEAEEKAHTIHLRTDQRHVAAAIAGRIRQHFGLSGQPSTTGTGVVSDS